MKYIVTDIEYDTDGEAVDLPKTLYIDVPDDMDPEEVDDFLSDEISNRTGFCHKGFSASANKLTDEQVAEVTKVFTENLERVAKMLEDRIDDSEGEEREALLDSYFLLILPEDQKDKYKEMRKDS